MQCIPNMSLHSNSTHLREHGHNHTLAYMPALQYFFVSCLSLQSVFGSVGNLLVIGAVCIVPALRTPSNYFIINLSFSDLLVTTVTQPSNILGALFGECWFLNRPVLCTIVSTLCATGCISSTYNICMIAVNRYVLICHYEVYDMIYTKTKTLFMCLGVWIIIYAIQLPNHIGWGDTRFSIVFYVCTFANHVHSYAIFYIGVGVVIPVAISFLAYLGIYLRVKNSNLVRNRILDGNTNDRRLPAADKKQMSRKMFHENVKVARALFRVYIIFLVMWLPVAIVILMGKGTTIHPVWYILTILLAHGNSSINCLVYAASLDHFREGYYTIMGLQRGRNLTRVAPTNTNANNDLPTRPRTSFITSGRGRISDFSSDGGAKLHDQQYDKESLF